MKTTATLLRQANDGITIPDGTYGGIWGGYQVCFTVGGVDFEAQAKNGIRTPRAKCLVVVKDGNLTVEVARSGRR